MLLQQSSSLMYISMHEANLNRKWLQLAVTATLDPPQAFEGEWLCRWLPAWDAWGCICEPIWCYWEHFQKQGQHNVHIMLILVDLEYEYKRKPCSKLCFYGLVGLFFWAVRKKVLRIRVQTVRLTVAPLLHADKWRMAGCSHPFISDIAHRRTRERSFGYFQLNISISAPHLHINLDWCCYSQYLRNSLSHSFERYCEILD